jgi:hypothetical protein
MKPIAKVMGKKKKPKREHRNKYGNAPRGPKRTGRNRAPHPQPSIDEIVQETPQIEIRRTQQETRPTQIEPRNNPTYQQYNDWQVSETFSDWNENINLYASNKVDLVLYDPKARLCLLVGAWQTGNVFRNQMRKFKEETGAVIEAHKNPTLGVRTALAYSTNPEEVRAYLNPEAEVLVGFPRIGKGTSLLMSHSVDGSNKQFKLNTILLHYLQRADANYFNI